MNVMFDVEIFFFNTWITIRRYFDCSHVFLEFLCIHTSMSLYSVFVWRTKWTYGTDDDGCTYLKLEVQKKSGDMHMGRGILNQ